MSVCLWLLLFAHPAFIDSVVFSDLFSVGHVFEVRCKYVMCLAAASVVSDAAASMCLERPLRSGLDPRLRTVCELVDRVHVGQDRAIMRHHDGALVLGLHFLAD